MIVEIIREAEDKLSKKKWKIYVGSQQFFTDLIILLDFYQEESRPTRRHKYRLDRYWDRGHIKHTGFLDQEVIKLLSLDVIEEVKDIIREK